MLGMVRRGYEREAEQPMNEPLILNLGILSLILVLIWRFVSFLIGFLWESCFAEVLIWLKAMHKGKRDAFW